MSDREKAEAVVKLIQDGMLHKDDKMYHCIALASRCLKCPLSNRPKRPCDADILNKSPAVFKMVMEEYPEYMI